MEDSSTTTSKFPANECVAKRSVQDYISLIIKLFLAVLLLGVIVCFIAHPIAHPIAPR